MSNSFKLENHTKKTKKDHSLFYTILFASIAIISLISYFIINRDTSDKYIEKAESNKDYVYTVKTVENMYSESENIVYDKIPALNLSGNEYSEINDEILNKHNQLMVAGNYSYYEYDFNISNDILSLVIKYMSYPQKSETAIVNFETYNIDLLSGEVLTDKNLLDRYNISEKKLRVYLESKFRSFYDDIIKSGIYTEKECSYSCFLKNRGISTNYLDDISFYVDNGSLTLFKYYNKSSSYGEEEYFKDDSYQFLIKK